MTRVLRDDTRARDAVDAGAVDVQLGVVDGARVEHDARAQRHDEDAQTLKARSKRSDQHLCSSHRPTSLHPLSCAYKIRDTNNITW